MQRDFFFLVAVTLKHRRQQNLISGAGVSPGVGGGAVAARRCATQWKAGRRKASSCNFVPLHTFHMTNNPPSSNIFIFIKGLHKKLLMSLHTVD